MKITLIDLGSPRRELNEPLGLEVISGKLLSQVNDNIELSLYYDELESIDIGKIIASDLPQILGISAKIGSIEKLNSILWFLSDTYPDLIVVVGDVYATYTDKILLELHENIICIKGEGEEALLGIINIINTCFSENSNQLKRRLITNDIPNLALKYDNQIISTSRRTANLDDYDIPYRFFIEAIITELNPQLSWGE